MKKKLGRLVRYVMLLNLFMGSMPLAYAEEIKSAVEQGKAQTYYNETVESAQEAVIPEVESQAEPPPVKDETRENPSSTEETKDETVDSSTEQSDEQKGEEKEKKEYDIRLPEVEEKKENEEEQSLRAQYGEPISEDGQEQIYKVDDTHFITYISGEVKTYKDEDGTESPVDLSLVTDTVENESVYKPSGSPVEVILPEKVDDTQGIQISKGEDTLELLPKDKTYENATVKENALLYNNVDEGDDVQYTITDNGVKEEIILEEWREKHEFTYSFSSKTYEASLEDNQVVIRKKGKKKVLFVLSAPEMVDQAGETSEDITLRLKEKDDQYELTIDASEEWLKDEKRAYPVRIDPTVTVPTENLIDTVTSSVHGTYQGRGYGYVGYITSEMTGIWNAKDVGRTRIYTKVNYNFSKIPKEAKIDNATYNLYQYIQYPQTNATFTSYKLTQDYDINSLTWDNSVGLTQEPTGENAVSAAKHGMHKFDIRDAVNSWV